MKVTAYEVLGLRLPESHDCASDLSDVVVCAVGSLLVHVTVVPALTCRVAGPYAKPLMETVSALADGGAEAVRAAARGERAGGAEGEQEWAIAHGEESFQWSRGGGGVRVARSVRTTLVAGAGQEGVGVAAAALPGLYAMSVFWKTSGTGYWPIT